MTAPRRCAVCQQPIGSTPNLDEALAILGTLALDIGRQNASLANRVERAMLSIQRATGSAPMARSMRVTEA